MAQTNPEVMKKYAKIINSDPEDFGVQTRSRSLLVEAGVKLCVCRAQNKVKIQAYMDLATELEEKCSVSCKCLTIVKIKIEFTMLCVIQVLKSAKLPKGRPGMARELLLSMVKWRASTTVPRFVHCMVPLSTQGYCTRAVSNFLTY